MQTQRTLHHDCLEQKSRSMLMFLSFFCKCWCSLVSFNCAHHHYWTIGALSSAGIIITATHNYKSASKKSNAVFVLCWMYPLTSDLLSISHVYCSSYREQLNVSPVAIEGWLFYILKYKQNLTVNAYIPLTPIGSQKLVFITSKRPFAEIGLLHGNIIELLLSHWIHFKAVWRA